MRRMKIKRIYFPALRQAALEEVELDSAPPPGRVLFRAEYSAVSAGTECANLVGNTSYAAFPFQPGYSAVGVVEAVGEGVEGFAPGDRVIPHWHQHFSHALYTPDRLFKIPSALRFDPKEAAFCHIATFPMLAVRKAAIALGESAMVVGLGNLGLLAVQMLAASGAYPVLASDMNPERRALALRLGATEAFDPSDPDYAKKVLAATGGKGVRKIIEVTGIAKALDQSLDVVAWMGTVVLLGCTRVSDVCIDFYKKVHCRGISLVGCHTGTRPKMESWPNMWTETDDYGAFLTLLHAKKLTLAPFISAVVTPAEAPEFYRRLITEERPPLGVVIRW